MSSGALMPLAEARGRLLAGVAPVAPTRLGLAEAVGATMAGAVAASADTPARAVALRDGWAVAADAVAGAAPHSPVLLPRRPAWLEAGEALPPGTDTVLDPEAIPGEGDRIGRIAVVADAAETEGTRAAGADQREGDILAAAGTRLVPRQVLALAACAIASVEVRIPAVRLVATGTHAVPVCSALAARVAQDGARVTEVVEAPDEAEAIARAILAAACDAVFVVGGTGFGRSDHSAAGLARAGIVTAHGLALRPGETAGFGRAAGRPVLLVPGRPDAALAAYLTLARPLIGALSGAVGEEVATAPLLRKVASMPGMSGIVFARREPGGIRPLGGAEIPLHRLALADAAILVPPEREGYGEGTTIEVIPL